MKAKIIHIGQYGIGKIERKSNVQGIGTDGLHNCIAVVLVDEHSIQLTHVDTNVHGRKVAQALNAVQGPYKLYIAYNEHVHMNFGPMLSDKNSPYTKEAFLANLEAGLKERNFPKWKDMQWVPLNGMLFGIHIDGNIFSQMKNAEFIRPNDSLLRFEINYIHYLTSNIPGKELSQIELDWQYLDNKWQKLPKLSYFVQKLCWVFKKNGESLDGYLDKLSKDTEMSAHARNILLVESTDPTGGMRLYSYLSHILSLSNEKKNIILNLNATFMSYYSAKSYTKAKQVLDDILSNALYIYDFSCLAIVYMNATALAIATKEFELAGTYLSNAELYGKAAGDVGKLEKIENKKSELKILMAKMQEPQLPEKIYASDVRIINKDESQHLRILNEDAKPLSFAGYLMPDFYLDALAFIKNKEEQSAADLLNSKLNFCGHFWKMPSGDKVFVLENINVYESEAGKEISKMYK